MKKFIKMTTAQFEAMQSVLHPAAITYLGGWIPDVVRNSAGQYIGLVYDRSYEVFASVSLSEHEVNSCRIPDDYIDPRRYPLLAAREAMRQLVDDLLGHSILAPGVL